MKPMRVWLAMMILSLMHAGTAQAYYDDDWLDKLSGPGGYRTGRTLPGFALSLRLLCVSKTSDQQFFDVRARTPGSTTPLPAPETLFTWLEPTEPGNTLIHWPSRARVAGVDAGTSENNSARYNCENDQRIVGYLQVKFARYESGENGLFVSDPDNDLYQVKIQRYSAEYMIRLTRYLDAGFGIGLARFSGEAFDTFYRPFGIPIQFVFAPAAIWKDTRVGRSVNVGVGLTWLGNFDTNDFCRGAACADVGRPLDARREIVPRVWIGIDPFSWWR